MSVLSLVVLLVYCAALLFITAYCLMQFQLLYHYKKATLKTRPQGAEIPSRTRQLASVHPTYMASLVNGESLRSNGQEGRTWPFVTIQLPIFNERYVVERLIDQIAAFDYPRDRFEIHILDDSTDETRDITLRKVEQYRAQGLQIEQIVRPDRKGFKAGALKDATPLAKGDFIAIFDADFLPRPDFLKQTIPWFEDERVGVVQTRWEHINENYSLITRLQALQLNVHFTVEQAGRMAGDHLLQFNGTAGVWRKETIIAAGGWEADTLTEDLDLSIRAQLKGWKIQYLEGLGSPAELPVEMNSLKSQQFRWMKGGAETAKKMLPTVWRSGLSRRKKLQTTFHLLGSTVYVCIFVTGIFSVPLVFLLGELMELGFSKHLFAAFLVGLLSIIAVYYVGNVQTVIQRGQPLHKLTIKFIILFPVFLALSMGLSLHNTVAVIQGYLGRKSPFVRTPKFNIKHFKDSFTHNRYLNHRLSWTTMMEGLLAVYFAGGVIGGIYLQNTTFFVFHLMLALGYGAIFFYTLRHLSLK